MRVHTRVVLDWQGRVLEDQSYEYEGPVALCGGGDVNIPEPAGPSPQELELMEKQTDLLEQQTTILNSQIKTQSLLAPFVYEQLGLKPTYAEGSDPNTKINDLTSQREQLKQQLSETPRYQGTQKVWVKGSGTRYYGNNETGTGGGKATAGHYETQNLANPAWTGLNDQISQLDEQIAAAKEDAKFYTGPEITGFEEVSKVSAERRAATAKSIEDGLSKGKSLAEIQRDADINEEDLNDYISTQLAERELKAFTGNLPVDPALQYEFQNQQQQMEETMRKRLGPDWRTTTPGMQAMDIFSRRKTDIIAAQQRGELQLAEALTQSREGSQMNQMTQTFGNLIGTAGYPFTNASAYAQNAQGYTNPLNYLQQDRWNMNNYNMQSAMTSAQANQSSMGSLFGGIGSLIGTGAGLIFPSDRRLKKNVRKIGFHVLPIYEYNYIWEEDDAPLHTGPMADDVEKVAPNRVVTIAGYKAIRYER